MRKRQLFKVLFLVSFWLAGNIFYVYFEGTVVGYDSSIYWATGGPYNFWSGLFFSSLVTIIAAFYLGLFEVLYFDRLLRKKPFGLSLLIKTAFYLFNIFLFTSLAVILNISFEEQEHLLHPKVLAVFGKYLSSPIMILILIYWCLIIVFSLFILDINDKFGKGILINLLLGKYHRPKAEIRIFMFLDMTSSTTIAEKLGAQKYSDLLRDFFFDLDEIIRKTEGAILQFVGDEVVILWNLEKGIKNLNCLQLFFLAEDKLKSLKNKYLEKYGLHPTFKAGIHYGHVIITEVGGSKQEIAYHGDAINTAARIRSSCTAFHNLMISEDLLLIIPKATELFIIESSGLSSLRGKRKSVTLYSVKRRQVA